MIPCYLIEKLSIPMNLSRQVEPFENIRRCIHTRVFTSNSHFDEKSDGVLYEGFRIMQAILRRSHS